MNEHIPEQCLLYLVATADVEPNVVDWLIDSDYVKGFSSMPISGHSADNAALSIAEQVEGRRRQILYLIRLPQADLEALLQGLQRSLGHVGLEYWAVPVTTYGKII